MSDRNFLSPDKCILHNKQIENASLTNYRIRVRHGINLFKVYYIYIVLSEFL
jgi:hypothetical protein